MATRNNPLEGWEPAFVVWVTSTKEVQFAVQFATNHNLCISVAGTGHDFLNRHSCDQGLMIRTILLKDIEWDLEDKNGLGATFGSVKFGSGIVFGEAHKSASDHGRAVASGWSITVGIAGWSMGGGHGPFSPMFGLGVDNVLEFDIVLADGSAATVNAQKATVTNLDGKITTLDDSDLFFAVRGGGGSTFGVVTSYTLRAHEIPDGGFTQADLSWGADMCSKDALYNFIDSYLSWASTLDSKWGGLAFVTPSYNASAESPCARVTVTVQLDYLYHGGKSDEEFVAVTSKIQEAAPGAAASATTFKDSWGWGRLKQPEDIIPVAWAPVIDKYYAGGVPSVLVGRDQVSNGALGAQMKKAIERCAVGGVYCAQMQLYQDITGNVHSPQDPTVSINPAMRSSLFHLVATVMPPEDDQGWYSLGAHSYFSESAYAMDGWQDRIWGADNYNRLAWAKARVDPNNVFWCRHCIGDIDDATMSNNA